MEIMVSMGLIAIISLFVLGVLSRLLFQGGKTAHQTAASMLAMELMERSVSAGPPDWGFGTNVSSEWKGERVLSLPGEDTETPFKYQFQALTLRDSVDDLGQIYQVKLVVWWWGEKADFRTDLGRTAIEQARTIYVRK